MHGGGDSSNSDAESFSDYYVPEFIQGQFVQRERRYADGWIGLRVKCPIHENCSKYRSMRMYRALGPSAAADYLNTWLNAALDHTRDSHMAYKPTLAECREHRAP